jgi:hypothetical protein
LNCLHAAVEDGIEECRGRGVARVNIVVNR